MFNITFHTQWLLENCKVLMLSKDIRHSIADYVILCDRCVCCSVFALELSISVSLSNSQTNWVSHVITSAFTQPVPLIPTHTSQRTPHTTLGEVTITGQAAEKCSQNFPHFHLTNSDCASWPKTPLSLVQWFHELKCIHVLCLSGKKAPWT